MIAWRLKSNQGNIGWNSTQDVNEEQKNPKENNMQFELFDEKY